MTDSADLSTTRQRRRPVPPREWSPRTRRLAALAANANVAAPTYGGWTQSWIDFAIMELEVKSPPHADLLDTLQCKSFLGRATVLRILGRSTHGDMRGCIAPIRAFARRLREEAWIPADAIPLIMSVYDGDEHGPSSPSLSGYEMAAGLAALRLHGADPGPARGPDT